MIRCYYCLALISRCCVFSVILLLTGHAAVVAVRAQSATATLSGTVEDENGAVVPSVSITVQNSATSLERQTVTGDTGSFTVPLLPPGTYTVTARRDGFTPVEVRNVVLNVGDQKALLIQLKTGTVSEMVQVNSDAPLINDSPAVGTTVDRQFVGNLPLNGRSFQSLIALTPGTVLTKSTSNEQGQFSVNGQRPDANYFTIDGVSANMAASASASLGQSGSGSLPGLAATGGTNNLVSVDALQEFRVQTSTYAPEFGRTPGAQVSIVTRGGTNQFHGSLFEYFRNDALDANDWFANSRRLPKSPLRQNDFGGVLGGPLLLPRFGEGGPSVMRGDRTFFFFSYEGLRLRLPQTAVIAVPSVSSRQSAPLQLQPFLNAFPIPNGRLLSNGLAEFNATFSNPSTLNATSIRIDQILTDRLTFFARYNDAPSESIRRSTGTISTLTTTNLTTRTLTAGTTWAISPIVSNDFRINYSRSRGRNFHEFDGIGGAARPSDSILFPASFSNQNALFTFTLTVPAVAFTVGKNADNLQRQVNLVNSLSMSVGSHQLKFGVDYRRLSPSLGPRNYAQTVSFRDVPRTLTGRANTVNIFSSVPVTLLFTNLSLFAQDTWKANRRLTLTYGLRWEYNPAPGGKNGNDPLAINQATDPTTIAYVQQGQPLWKTTYDNFAPRVGVAYQLFQTPGRETILRGGFGIFYDLGTQQAGSLAGSNTPPFGTTKSLSNVVYPLTSAQAQPRPFSLTPPIDNARLIDPQLKAPRTYQWNVSIEQSIGASQTVSSSYVAAVGRKLLRTETLFSPNPNFSSFVFLTTNAATSDYHALQLQYSRRLSRGFQALASYTWGHSIDTASNDSNFQLNTLPGNRFDPNLDRGSSDFDVRHAFNLAVTYNLPAPKTADVIKAVLGNWAIDTMVGARTGTSVDLIGGSAFVGFFTFVRPDVISGVPLYVNDPMAPGGRRFNRAAFTAPPLDANFSAARQGTLGRNVLRGLSVSQIDIALRRQFNLSERVNLQFRAEFFNILNHPNFGDPGINFDGGNDIASPSFGLSTQMLGRSLAVGGAGLNSLYQIGGPRSIQFALKLQL